MGCSYPAHETALPTRRGYLTADDPSSAIAACVVGLGLFQSLEQGLGGWLARGELIEVLADWTDETFPLYAYHPSRHLPPAKVRAFLDFVQHVIVDKAAGED